jgi:hypothetical protein
MKKLAILPTLFLAATLSVSSAAPVLITDFTESITADAPWTWTSGTKTLTISGNNDQGVMFPDTAPALNLTGNNQITITLASLIVTNPGGGFYFTLEDSGGKTATATFNWNSFTSGQSGASLSNTASLNPELSFDASNVINWNLADGGSGGSGNLSGASFVSVQAVPEPGAYALMAVAGVAWFAFARRRKALV